MAGLLEICLKPTPINFTMMNARGGRERTEGSASFMCVKPVSKRASKCVRERVSAALVKQGEEWEEVSSDG